MHGELVVVDDVPGEFAERVIGAFHSRPHDAFSFAVSGGELARARLALVTVAGDDKREALARVAADDPDVPASHIRADRVLWIVDPAAAGDLA